jgi:phosphoribosyl-ATP pyrophosphohydrolase
MLLSVIIPVFNREKKILECLNSIAAQRNFSKDDFEVIVVDDCSTDGTFSVLQNYSDIKNFWFFGTDENSGTASTPRNIGLQYARGEYVLFIDSDDKLAPYYFEKFAYVVDKGKVDMVVMPFFAATRGVGITFFQEHKEDLLNIDLGTATRISDRLRGNAFIVGRPIKRQLISENHFEFPVLRSMEDQIFCRLIWGVSKTISIVGNDKPYYIYEDARGISRRATYPLGQYRFVKNVIYMVMNCENIPKEKKIICTNSCLSMPHMIRYFENKEFLSYFTDEDVELIKEIKKSAAELKVEIGTAAKYLYYSVLNYYNQKNTLLELEAVVADRKKYFTETGKTIDENEKRLYTCYLFEQGQDKILKKCGEECTEMVIAAKNDNNDELKNEISDLFYHIMVLCVEKNLPFSDVLSVLDERRKKIGNCKVFKQIDKNS